MLCDVNTPGLASSLLQFLVLLSGTAVLGAALGWTMQKNRRERIGLELQALHDRFNRLKGEAADRDAQRTGLLRRVEALQIREKELTDELDARKRAAGSHAPDSPTGEQDEALLQQLHKARQRASELEKRLSDMEGQAESNVQEELISNLQGTIKSMQEEHELLREQLRSVEQVGDRGTVDDLRTALDLAEQARESLAGELTAAREQLKIVSSKETLSEQIQDLLEQKDDLEHHLRGQGETADEPGNTPADKPPLAAGVQDDPDIFLIPAQDGNNEGTEAVEPALYNSGGDTAFSSIRDVPVLSRGYELLPENSPPGAIREIRAVSDEPEDVKDPKDRSNNTPGQPLNTARGEKDDLTAIVGIGPFIEARLNAIGITTYGQIARMDEEDAEQVTRLIAFFPGRIQRDGWVRQASKLLRKKNKGAASES